MKGFMTAAGLGAGLMFLLDPDRGPRRRALIRDKFTKVNNDVEEWVSGMAKDLSNRVHGIRAELESKWRSDEAVTDEQLVARVRARLGHLVSHPRAIDVRVENGVVTISGPVLSHEAGRLLSGVSHVRGIRKVEDQLQLHRNPDGVPELLGGAPRELAAGEWATARRVVRSATGSALFVYGLRRGGLFGSVMALYGAGLVTRCLMNQPLGDMLSGARADDREATYTSARAVPTPSRALN